MQTLELRFVPKPHKGQSDFYAPFTNFLDHAVHTCGCTLPTEYLFICEFLLHYVQVLVVGPSEKDMVCQYGLMQHGAQGPGPTEGTSVHSHPAGLLWIQGHSIHCIVMIWYMFQILNNFYFYKPREWSFSECTQHS